MANFNNSRVLHSGILSKHELFRIIGDQLTSKNVQDLVEKHDDLLVGSLGPLVVDGYSFFLALESVGNVVDTSDILKILTMCGRMDLAQFANYRRRKTVEMDPVDQYLEQTAKSSVMLPSWMQRQHSWVRCSLRGQDLKEEGAGSSRPGSSNGAESSSSSCSPSTSKSQQTAEAQPAPSPSTSKQTTPSGVKRKGRRGSLTYNKSHNRLKRSRTVEALPVSKCLREQGESTNQIKGDQPAGQSSLRSSSNISDSSINEINRRVTRSRTRSAGVPLMSGVGTYSRPGSGVCDNVRSSVPADVRSSNKTEATSEVPTTSAASTNSSSHSSHNSSSPQAASTSLSQQENSKVAPDLKDNDSSAVSASTTNSVEDQTSESSSTGGSNNRALDFEEIKKKVTCDIRLRVRAEYCYHDSALDGNIFSNKPELIERQFEKFMQANTILKSRDLGSIICDIKFSELTYLDAFWRDYINGSLLEALKGVFITDSLKQAVGHEAIKLLVNVDEDDYESGRFKLLQNLKD